jgi:hypothetical protein
LEVVGAAASSCPLSDWAKIRKDTSRIAWQHPVVAKDGVALGKAGRLRHTDESHAQQFTLTPCAPDTTLDGTAQTSKIGDRNVTEKQLGPVLKSGASDHCQENA